MSADRNDLAGGTQLNLLADRFRVIAKTCQAAEAKTHALRCVELNQEASGGLSLEQVRVYAYGRRLSIDAIRAELDRAERGLAQLERAVLAPNPNR